jgi:hypothetical protein
MKPETLAEAHGRLAFADDVIHGLREKNEALRARLETVGGYSYHEGVVHCNVCSSTGLSGPELGNCPQCHGRGAWEVVPLARLHAVEAALEEIAKLLGPIGPDEVLDQDVPAIEGRRWIISDEKGMAIIGAFRIARAALTDPNQKGEGDG